MRIPRVLLVCVGILAATFAFAGGQSQAPGTTGPGAASVDPDTGRQMIGNMFVTGLPIVREPVTFDAFVGMHGLTTDILEMEVYKRVEEMTNVRIRGEFLYAAGRTERKNLLLASSDLPDLFIGEGVTAADLVTYGPQGLFVELSELIAEYAPNVQRLFKLRPEYKRMITTPDGGIYSLPTINELLFRENPDNMFINKTWLDALGLDVPQTTEQYRDALRAFKASDPNGNGIADEIPLTFMFNDANAGLWSLFGAFGATVPSPAFGLLVGIDNDRVVFRPTGDSARPGLEYLRGLYAEGLLDPEGFTQNLAQFNAKGRQDPVVYGSFFDYLDENAVGQERAQEHYVPLPPLRGPGGDQGWNRYDGQFMASPAGFVITSANSSPEVAMRWINELFEERLALELARGPFGTTLREMPDGRIEFMPTPAGMGYGEFRFSNAPGLWPGMVLSDMYERIVNLPAGQARKLENYYIYESHFPAQVYPGLMFNAEQERRLAILKTDIHSYVEQMFAKWIVGDEPMNDAAWQTYLTQLNRMGLDELLSIYQTRFDEYRR